MSSSSRESNLRPDGGHNISLPRPSVYLQHKELRLSRVVSVRELNRQALYAERNIARYRRSQSGARNHMSCLQTTDMLPTSH